MKIINKDGSKVDLDPKKHKLISLKKTVEVTATAKNHRKTGTKYLVPEHMVEHLLKKGMIEPVKKAKE